MKPLNVTLGTRVFPAAFERRSPRTTKQVIIAASLAIISAFLPMKLNTINNAQQDTQQNINQSVTAPQRLERMLIDGNIDVVINPEQKAESQFINYYKSRFNYVAKSNLQNIWKQAEANNVDPRFSAAIVWKETQFHTRETSVPTCYGYSRGEYQILDSTARSYGVKNPETALYNPSVAAVIGNKVIKSLFDMFNGKAPGTGYVFFKTVKVGHVNGVTFKGYLLRDQNGQVIPVSILVAMAYDGGPTVIYGAASHAAKYKSYIIIDPRSPHCPFSYQQLDYVRKIASNGFYNFQNYHFSYKVDDVPQNELI